MLRSLLAELPPPPDGKTGWPWTAEGRIPSNEDVRWPKISIVTPSYNQAPFLEETIRSVLLQGYPNLEYIIIDGGSTDGSVEIIRKYEKWLAYWVSEPDQGQSNAINKGWRRATGEICAWLNSDDVYLPGALKNVARSFIESPERELLYGNLLYIDQKSDIDGYLHAPPFSLKELMCGNYIPQPATFLKRKALERVGYLKENLHFCMDYDLWLRVAIDGEVAHLPKTLAAFRFHPQSKTMTQLVHMTVELAEIAERFLREAELSPDLKREGFELLARSLWEAGVALWFAGRVGESERYLVGALRGTWISEAKQAAISLARAAVQCCGAEAVGKINQFIGAFPQLKFLRRSAIGWAYVFLYQDLNHSTLERILQAIWYEPSISLLRAGLPYALRGILGKHHRTLQRFKNSLTGSPVGLSLSELLTA